MSNRIRELRKEKKLTQEELGVLLGVKRTTITGYEIGQIDPSSDKLVKLSELFGVTADYLLGRTAIRNPKESGSVDVAVKLRQIIDSLSEVEIRFDGMVLNDMQREILEDFLMVALRSMKALQAGTIRAGRKHKV